MKKEALAFIIAAGMMSVMTGCGSQKTDDVSNGTEQPSYNEAVTENQNAEETENIEETEVEEEVVIEPTQEILDAELADNKVQLGNHVIQFPISFQDFIDKGVVLTSEDNPNTEIVEPNQGAGFSFVLDGKDYYSFADNIEEKRLQMKDCLVRGVAHENHIDIISDAIFAKGIRIGSTIDELKSVWGEPNEDFVDFYEYYQERELENSRVNEYVYTVYLDLETETIRFIDFSCNDVPEDAPIVTESAN